MASSVVLPLSGTGSIELVEQWVDGKERRPQRSTYFDSHRFRDCVLWSVSVRCIDSEVRLGSASRGSWVSAFRSFASSINALKFKFEKFLGENVYLLLYLHDECGPFANLYVVEYGRRQIELGWQVGTGKIERSGIEIDRALVETWPSLLRVSRPPRPQSD